MKPYPQETPQFRKRQKAESWRSSQTGESANVAIEKHLKALDPLSNEDLFTEAQLEDFHRRVMNKVAKTQIKPVAKTEIMPEFKLARAMPFVSMLGFLILSLPHSVRLQFQKISSAVSYIQKH